MGDDVRVSAVYTCLCVVVSLVAEKILMNEGQCMKKKKKDEAYRCS